jgi:sulfur relay (sulfurtransferase) complex TusBCD TusD component (DsrE family)
MSAKTYCIIVPDRLPSTSFLLQEAVKRISEKVQGAKEEVTLLQEVRSLLLLKSSPALANICSTATCCAL